MATPDPEAFIEKFRTKWSDPVPETFAALWHEDGTLLHPTMGKSIRGDEIVDYVRRLQSVAPDIHLEVKRWAASGADIFIEWTITGTRSGEDDAVTWDGMDRFTLDGDKAVEGIAYFDTAPLWARIDPSMDRGDLLDAIVAAVEGDADEADALGVAQPAVRP